MMKDEEDGEQISIESRTSKRGLLGNMEAYHHLRTLSLVEEDRLGEGRKHNLWVGGQGGEVGLSSRFHTRKPCVYYPRVRPEPADPVSTKPTVCLHVRCYESSSLLGYEGLKKKCLATNICLTLVCCGK